MGNSDAEKIIKDFLDAYLVRRDYESTIAYLDETIQWIGTGASEYSSSYAETTSALWDELRASPWPCAYAIQRMRLVALTAEVVCAHLSMMLEVQLPEGSLKALEGRITATCQYRAGRWRIVSIHFSTPDFHQLEGEYFPRVIYSEAIDETQVQNQLEQEICSKRRQEEEYSHIFDSVFCGIAVYSLDEDGSVRYEKANREAIRIFGYTPEEFWAKDNWNLSNLTIEEDRARVFALIEKLKAPGDKVDFEYRIAQKNGEPIWVLGTAELTQIKSNGTLRIQSVLMDVNETKLMAEENQALAIMNAESNALLHLALANTSVYEFFYYPAEQRAICPQRTADYFGMPPMVDNALAYVTEHLLDEAFKGSLDNVCQQLQTGGQQVSVEFKDKNGNWDRLTISATADDDGAVVGLVENITKEKEMAFALEEAHSLDGLTGLYNKEAGLKKVRRYLAQKPAAEPGVIMILDMDDFRRLNDEEGETFADMILVEVADILRECTGPEDIILRLGGDEFMLYIKNSGKEQATVLGPMIAERIRGISFGEEQALRVSASIGMCATTVVDEFNGLYRCAESTLQYVKTNGKGTAACYLDTSNELGTMLTQIYPEEHLLNEVDRTDFQKRNLADMALEVLSKSKRLDDAVNLILAKIGKAYQLDRVSITELDRDYHSFRYSYQWAKNKSDLQMGQVFYLTPGRMDVLPEEYDAEGLCSGKFHPLSRMDACLRCAIWNYGVYAGSFSFERRQADFQWPEEYRQSLKELTQIVATFVTKAHADAVSQAKTEFLSRMSHEIRTPMNAISGMTLIAKASLDDKQKALECLNKIERSNQYLLGLINDILEMSRIESGKIELAPEWVSLAEVNDLIREMFASQAQERDVSLTFKHDYPAGSQVWLDVLRFNQVAINIIGNAIKFTKPGGNVVAHTQLLHTDGETAHIAFRVTDTGIGIAPEALDRIFRSFEQADADMARKYGGTGLGLTISSSLVRLMGGTLQVESTVGKGSAFYFTLPLKYRLGDSAAEQPKAVAAAVSMTGKRMLLVEDNVLNMEIASTLLEMEGIGYEQAFNGKEAVERFLSQEPGYFDAILMDIQMPVMDGLEATKAIRLSDKADARTIPIIAMTANAFHEDEQKSIASGMNGHISKPFDLAVLLKTLKSCIK